EPVLWNPTSLKSYNWETPRNCLYVCIRIVLNTPTNTQEEPKCDGVME
ncbi:unnamed protein product, partial [Allacma fusca]